MATEIYQRKVTKRWAPAAPGTNETVSLITLKKGYRVTHVSVRRAGLATGTSSAVVIQASAGPTALSASIDLKAGAVGDLVDGSGGAGLNQGGYLALADQSIQAAFTQTAGTGTPILDITVEFERIWPA